MAPLPIDNRCMEYCYITEVSHIAEMHIYLGQMYPLQVTIDVWNITAPNMLNIIAECTYTYGRCTLSN